MYRPSYHFLPEKNWMNDPNGVCWFRGEYHLFYQHNPTDDEWGNLHWGHAVSKDCVNWEHRPLALYPSHEKGEIHCFSGCACVDGEHPMLYYTSVGRDEEGRDCRTGAQQWCAVSDDTMECWNKYENNPIMTKDIHGGLEVEDWRDPFVWKEQDGWYMALGASVEGKGAALLYRSPDQLHWEYLHIIRSDNAGDRIWECPNYFKLIDKQVLVVSPDGPPRYWIGREKEHQFEAESEGIIDHSGWEGFYAPNSFTDNRGRRIMIGWLTENSRGELDIPGWKGVQSLPRVLTFKDRMLYMEPLPELSGLRQNCESADMLRVDGVWEAKTRGKALELELEFIRGEIGDRVELEVFASRDCREKTLIVYDNPRDTVYIDRSGSNRRHLTSTKELSCVGTKSPDQTISLRIFLDFSTLEVFINGREVISTRVYPDGEDSDRVRVRARESLLRIMKIYEIKHI